MSVKGYVSTGALGLLSQHDRNLILLDTYGRAITYLNPVVESLTNTKYRICQYDTFRNPENQHVLYDPGSSITFTIVSIIMIINLEPKTGLELFAVLAICALVLTIGSNPTWNVFADSCTSSCENTVTTTVDSATAYANAVDAYQKEVNDGYTNHQNAMNQAYASFVATEKSDPQIAEIQYEKAIQKAKIDLRDALMKAEMDYEMALAKINPAIDESA